MVSSRCLGWSAWASTTGCSSWTLGYVAFYCQSFPEAAEQLWNGNKKFHSWASYVWTVQGVQSPFFCLSGAVRCIWLSLCITWKPSFIRMIRHRWITVRPGVCAPCGVEAAFGAAWKVSLVSSHQTSAFNLSQCAWGKVVIQLLLPSSTGLHISSGGNEGWTEHCSCPPPLPSFSTYSNTHVYILIYNEHVCPTELRLICCWEGGTSQDDKRDLQMADRSTCSL